MNKASLVQSIIQQLQAELDLHMRAAKAAHAEATHEQSKAENKYDTRGLEAAYLARGQSTKVAAIAAAIASFEKLASRTFGPGVGIDIGALVELEQRGERTFYFIGDAAGGTEVLHEGKEVLVITPQSPLGQQLMDKKQGDLVEVALPGLRNKYRVVAVA